MKPVYHLFYSSMATGYVSPKVVQEILSSSRRNNQAVGVTGLLLYRAGRFLQILGGSKSSVQETFHRIQNDRRHSGVSILAEFETVAPIFPNWQMGFIEDEAYSQELSQRLESVFTSPIAVAGDIKKQVIQIFGEITRAKIF